MEEDKERDLEILHTVKGIMGSNPTLSAINLSY